MAIYRFRSPVLKPTDGRDDREKLNAQVIASICSVTGCDQLADAAIEMFSPRYAHAVANGPSADVLVRWLILSSFLLPGWGVFELFWEFADEWKSLWIDASFTFSWFLTFWLTVGYAFTHRVLFI